MRLRGTTVVTGFRITDADIASLRDHADARRTLAALGEAELARGAAIVSTVAAYTLAATTAADAAALARAIGALAGFVSSVEPERQSFVATMLDAALAAQVATRMAAGLPPHGRRMGGWMVAVAEAGDPGDTHQTRSKVSPAAALRYAACSRADDIDAVLIAVTPVVARMVEAARSGTPSAALLDLVQAHGLSLCVFAPTTPYEALPTIEILRKTLKRRRPLAASILAAVVAHGRRGLG